MAHTASASLDSDHIHELADCNSSIMVDTNRSIDQPEEIKRIILEPTINNEQYFRYFLLKGNTTDSTTTTCDSGSTPSKTSSKQSNHIVDMRSFEHSPEDSLTMENKSSEIFLRSHEHQTQLKEQTSARRAFPRRNSAIASMLFGVHSIEKGQSKSADPTQSRQRFQRRNSAVASMLFPSLLFTTSNCTDIELHSAEVVHPVQPLSTPDSLTNDEIVQKVLSSDTKRRRSSMPWSQVYEPSNRQSQPSPECKKLKIKDDDEESGDT